MPAPRTGSERGIGDEFRQRPANVPDALGGKPRASTHFSVNFFGLPASESSTGMRLRRRLYLTRRAAS